MGFCLRIPDAQSKPYYIINREAKTDRYDSVSGPSLQVKNSLPLKKPLPIIHRFILMTNQYTAVAPAEIRTQLVKISRVEYTGAKTYHRPNTSIKHKPSLWFTNTTHICSFQVSSSEASTFLRSAFMVVTF